MFVLKGIGVQQNGTLMIWIKRDTVFFLYIYPVLSTYLLVDLLIFSPDHLFLLTDTTDHPTSDLHQELPGVGLQIDLSKNQEQPSTSSRDIVRVDQPTNLSGYSLRIANLIYSREKELELSYYRPKLPFTISAQFVLSVPQVKGPRP